MTLVIIPYVNELEISELRQRLYNIPCLFMQDTKKIGSDLMFEKMWNNCDSDVIILHSDMMPIDSNNQWYYDLCDLAKSDDYMNYGMFGCKLLYPELEGKTYVQSAGGKFVNNRPDHFGSGIDIDSQSFFKEPEEDVGQYDFLRKVAWTTFGGIYIRRQVINDVGNFDRRYLWTYNRDVDYCLKARSKGWDILQTPITLIHHESKDNKQIMKSDSKYNNYWSHNLKILLELWEHTELYRTIDERV